MADPDKTPLPEDPPVTIAEDEVERLLAQAKSLTDQIASEAGMEPPAVDGIPLGETPAAATIDSDPLAVTEDVERTLAELGALVGNDAPSATEAPEPEPRGPAPRIDARPADEEGAIEEAAGPSERATSAASPLGAEGIAGVEEGVPTDDSGRPARSTIDFDESLLGDVAVDLEDADNPASANEAVGKPAPGPVRSRTVKELLKAKVTAGPEIARRAARAGANGSLALLEFIDRPFAGLPPTAKKVIGWVALATLLAGIASFVLPGLLEHNPYEKMGR